MVIRLLPSAHRNERNEPAIQACILNATLPASALSEQDAGGQEDFTSALALMQRLSSSLAVNTDS
jgi:hypothetical protein